MTHRAQVEHLADIAHDGVVHHDVPPSEAVDMLLNEVLPNGMPIGARQTLKEDILAAVRRRLH